MAANKEIAGYSRKNRMVYGYSWCAPQGALFFYISGLRYIKSNADEIDHVYILGHSLNEVDQPYFKEISKSLQNKKWICSYYSENEIERLANSLKDFQIDDYEFKKMQEIEIINN